MSSRSRSQLSVHTGGQSATMEEINRIKRPDRTESYAPVSHGELIEIIKQEAEDQLHDYNFLDEHYGLSPKNGENTGAKLFGVLSYQSDISPDISLSIGLRNSYDQSLAVGVCMGAKVFVCDNLMFSGDIRVSRKHTGDVLEDVQKMISNSMSIAPMRHRDLLRDAESMKDFDLNDDEAWSILGMGYGRGILRPRQLLASKEAWLKPPQKEFEDRNLWSLYNSMTEALKSSSARDVLESHSKAHSLVMNQGMKMLNGMEVRQVA